MIHALWRDGVVYAAGTVLSRGIAQNNLGDLPQALDDLNRAVSLAPRNAVATNQRGLVHARMGNRAQAIADFTEAARLDPNTPAYAKNRHLLEAGFANLPRT